MDASAAHARPHVPLASPPPPPPSPPLPPVLPYGREQWTDIWGPPALFTAAGVLLSIASITVALVLLFSAAGDEPFMVWDAGTFAYYVFTPLPIAVLWAFWFARLVVRHRPMPGRTGVQVLWAVTTVWVILNLGFLALGPMAYLSDMWRMGDSVYLPD